MLDQAATERDENIAHFLLQQSIIPGSAYDRPLEMGTGFNVDDNATGHWGMEKLRAYIATIREKFQPTLSPEASELLENHYSLCRQSTSENSLPVTVRFLESMIRLSQAHARLMYRNTVSLDDAVAVILLMECTAAASRGGMFGGGLSYGVCADDLLYKSPIDTDFEPFDVADEVFEKEKQTLLKRYQQMKPCNSRTDDVGGDPSLYYQDHSPNLNGRRSWDDVGQRRSYQAHSFLSNNQFSIDKDQFGRQRMSQVMSQVASPQSCSRKHYSIRQVMETLEQIEQSPSTRASSNILSQGSHKRVTFSQLPEQIEHSSVASNQHPVYNVTDDGNVSQRGGFESCYSGVQLYQPQPYEESGGFIRTQEHEFPHRASFTAHTDHEEIINVDSFVHGGQSGIISRQQSQISSKKDKKRRTAD
jgi:hypothetical protein